MPSSSGREPISWDIDTYLNRFIPRPRLHVLPTPISRFLGHREAPPPPIAQPLLWLYAFIGAFTGILLTSLFFRIPYLVALTSTSFNAADPTSGVQSHLLILGSLGATAILEYNAITSPLSQPRNAILGQGLSALVGVALIRLFALGCDQHRLEDLRWVIGSLAVGISSAVMGMTKTLHPPAGATALLAVTSPQVGDLGWLLVPVVMAAATIMIVVALIVNNIQRQFPLWWWTELPLGEEKVPDEEKGSDLAKVQSNVSGTTVGTNKAASEDWSERRDSAELISISADRIHVPEFLKLSAEEFAFLEGLKVRFEGGSDHEPRESSGGVKGTEGLADCG